MPLLNLKLNVEHVQTLFNPDVILGGLITVDNNEVTIDSIVFTADQTIT